MGRRYFAYKQALLREAKRLVDAGILQASDDMFYLRLDEFREVVRTNNVDGELIRTRREKFRGTSRSGPPECSPPMAKPSTASTGEMISRPVPWPVFPCRPEPLRDAPGSS